MNRCVFSLWLVFSSNGRKWFFSLVWEICLVWVLMFSVVSIWLVELCIGIVSECRLIFSFWLMMY